MIHLLPVVVWRGAAAVLDWPPGLGEEGTNMQGPDKACSVLSRQMTLALRHGGLGFRMQSYELSDAAFVAGAGQADRNLKGRPTALCPLQGTPLAPEATCMNNTRSCADGPQLRRTCQQSS